MRVLTGLSPITVRQLTVIYEPMRRNIWVLTNHSEQGLQVFFIRMDDDIKMTIDNEIPYMNTPTWLVSHMSWDPIKFKIIDTLEGSPDYFREWMMSYDEMITGRMRYASNDKRNILL